ncbi:MAG: hypothetical protein JWQ71_1885 [Pedosphaera sp.]|nr:hypothetical protein [Pedosphaera sp.]
MDNLRGLVDNLYLLMKTNLLTLLLSLLVVTGCASRYVMTLNNGSTYVTKGKPHLDKARNRYVFKDITGEQREVSPLQIRELAPESMQDTQSSNFKSKPR